MMFSLRGFGITPRCTDICDAWSLARIRASPLVLQILLVGKQRYMYIFTVWLARFEISFADMFINRLHLCGAGSMHWLVYHVRLF